MENLNPVLKKEKKVALIDGSSVLFRYAFASNDLITEDGVSVSGLYNFCNLILNFSKKYDVIVAFDKCKNNFRKTIDPEYKKNRVRDISHIITQVELAIQFCKFSNIRCDFHLEYEADDIIATHVKNNQNMEFIVVSTDKDLLQLVDDKCKVFNPFTRVTYNREKVLEKYGILPEKISFFLALCGDASDNIRGVKGIGSKTAVQLINEGYDMENLKTKPLGKFCKYDFSDIDKLKSLTELFSKVPLPNIERLDVDKSGMSQFFSAMNFRSLQKLV